MKRERGARTPAGLVITQLEEAVRSQETDLLLPQIAASPVVAWDVLMEDVLAQVLRFMCHCRHMLLHGHLLTVAHMSAHTPSGKGERPRGNFAFHPRFLRNSFYYYLQFRNPLAYETHYEQHFAVPQGYPADGRFLPDNTSLQLDVPRTLAPFSPVPPLKVGTKFAALLGRPLPGRDLDRGSPGAAGCCESLSG